MIKSNKKVLGYLLMLPLWVLFGVLGGIVFYALFIEIGAWRFLVILVVSLALASVGAYILQKSKKIR
jgi:hypothetical protein